MRDKDLNVKKGSQDQVHKDRFRATLILGRLDVGGGSSIQSKDTRITIICNHCRWRIIDLNLEGNYCHAYPPKETKGIPDRFLYGEDIHDSIQKDQKGKLILEPDEGQEGIVKYLKGDK